MSVYNEGAAITRAVKGLRVDRATAALPATTAEALFTVTGGRVAITQILGEVTTVIETQANDTKLTATPTVGTAVDICAALDITADEAGALYGITGLNSDALIGLNAGLVPGQLRDVIVNAGTIDLACAATNTGAVKWSVLYYPIDDGATVVAA